MDIRDSLLVHEIRSLIPTAPLKQKMNFKMQKGNVMDFNSSLSIVKCGLGWDVTMGKEIDVDSSCCIFSR
jgi:hypothetical protein